MDSSSQQAPSFGVNLFGYLTADLGLGVAARNTAHLLLASDTPCRFVDVNPGDGMQGRHTSLAEKIEADRTREAFSVNLFHVNPDQILYLLRPFGSPVTLPGRVNACVPFWELPRLPDSWVEPLGAMDAIFAPTRFVESAIRDRLPDAPVIHYPQAVHVPADIRADRAAFGLPDDAVVFAMSFDMRSDIERKNPWGAIDAFLQAFPEREDVRLVIKATNVETIRGLERNAARLREAASDPRVVVLDHPMSYRDILTLYASSDVLVSLHRSEGLGLSLLEGMSLGKPVVATGWSGNMDFMTAENSIPIGYTEVPVAASTQPAYMPTMSGAQFWAEPDVAEAASALARLADSPDLRSTVGARAAADAAARFAAYESGAALLPALRALADAGPTDAAARLRQLKSRYVPRQVKRIARAAVRRLRLRLGA